VQCASKFEKCANAALKIVWQKSKNVFKIAEFHADFKSVEKVSKKCTQKSYKENKFDEHE
jgi:hypothetical protein